VRVKTRRRGETRERSFFQDWEPVIEIIGKDIEASVRGGQTVGASPPLRWRIALRVVQKLDDYADASHIAGIACVNGCTLIEHDWVCRQDVMIIDPTLPYHEGVTSQVWSSEDVRDRKRGGAMC
jgi:hypothetical protein